MKCTINARKYSKKTVLDVYSSFAAAPISMTSIQLSKLTGVSLQTISYIHVIIPLQHHINKRCGINILGQIIQDLLLLENMHWYGLSYINHALHVYAIALSAKRTSKEKINQIQRYMHDYMCENKTYTNINYNCAEL